jgi:two-component system response regulator PilR (NtrC family)
MKPLKNILIIDDEPDILGLLSMTLERMGYTTQCAENFKKASKLLSENTFNLCLTDLRLPDGSGIDIVKQIQKSESPVPVIVITAHGSMDIAIEAMKFGAFDFINKPVDLNNLRTLINNALLSNENTPTQSSIIDLVGESVAAIKLKENIAKVSRSQAPVFIHGESGSGKELVARAIHKASSRNNNSFVAVNCGAIPRELMESEFFGHTKGSFTGAHQDKQGLFQSAEGGTLFLDEVADLPMEMQVKLLRAIQEKSIRPVGSQKEMPINVRILSATHKNLLNEIQKNQFRNDLYYRINVIEINVPSLRERKSDVTLLTHTLLNRIAKKNNEAVSNITNDALIRLGEYSFPGNVRELENILERASALCSDNTIQDDDLQLNGQSLDSNNTHQTNISTTYAVSSDANSNQNISSPNTTFDLNNASYNIEQNYNANKESIDSYLEKIEKNIILSRLEKQRWNRTSTAKQLGITFRSLRYRMKKLGLDVDDE